MDRINARAITKKSPPYEVPIIDAVYCKDGNGEWFKRRFTFEPVNPTNIDAQDSNEDIYGMIEVKIWRCTKKSAEPKLPDEPQKTPVYHTSQYDQTRNNLTHVACLGREEYPTHRRYNPSGKKIKDQIYRIEYVDTLDSPYAVFQFQYGSKSTLSFYLSGYSVNEP